MSHTLSKLNKLKYYYWLFVFKILVYAIHVNKQLLVDGFYYIAHHPSIWNKKRSRFYRRIATNLLSFGITLRCINTRIGVKHGIIKNRHYIDRMRMEGVLDGF